MYGVSVREQAAHEGKAGFVIASLIAANPPSGTDKGWWFNTATNTIKANAANTDLDDDDNPYNEY